MKDEIAELARQEARPIVAMTRLVIEAGIEAWKAGNFPPPLRALRRGRVIKTIKRDSGKERNEGNG